jgi:hypothetical protein
LLLGPSNASGAPLAATWLAGCAAGLLDASSGDHTIVSMTTPLVRGQEAFLRAASAVVLVAPADTKERIEALRAVGTSLVSVAECCSPCLVVDGSTDYSYEEIRTASGVHVAGQLEGVSEQVLLRNRPRRRDAKSAQLLDELSGRIAFLAAEGNREGQGRAA